MQIHTLHATYIYGAQFQHREFFSRNNNASNKQFSSAQFQHMEFFSHNNNASNKQFSSALEYVSSPAPSALPDKETREGAFVPLSSS